MGDKNQRKKRNLLFCILLVLFFNANAAYAKSADQYYEIGVRAAQQQQFHLALKSFLQAKAAGLESPALHYNLGVVYYNLASYDEASKSFQPLLDNAEYAGVAYYNLGLISLKLSNEPAAKDWFLKAYSTTEDPNLKDLSERALTRLNVDPMADKSMPEKSILIGWGGVVSLSAGYDDNVSLIDEDISQTSGLEDYHLELFATANRMIWGTEGNGLHFDANVDALKQHKEHDYDYSQWHLGLAHQGIFSQWNTRARATMDQTQFGNVDFQQLVSLEFRSERDLSTNSGMELRYKYVNIEDQSPNAEYDYLAGSRQQLRFRFANILRNVSFKYSYEFQLNDRSDLTGSRSISVNTTEIGFRSYSPMRHSVQVSADVPWGRLLTLSLDAQYRYSYYSDADTIIDVDNATGARTVLYSLNRKDHRYRVNIGLAYRFSGYLEFFGDYSYTKNDSNRSGSDYDHNLIRAGVTWFY
jgi:tetratricopeptide (TPR) repeat protein